MSHAQDDDLPELGSLGQSARGKHLKGARITMFVVGVLTLVANVGVGLFAKDVVERAIQQELRNVPPAQVDPVRLEELKKQAVRTTQLASGLFAAVGVVFLVLGALVYRAPVATTSIALILYIAGWAVSGLVDPTMLVKGIILKIIIIVALVRALKAAIEYQKESVAAEAA